MQQSLNQFWEFSLQFYRNPVVKNLCLQAQDDFGLNVNLILFMSWLGRQSYHLDEKQLHSIEANVNALADFTEKIRALRKQIQANDLVSTQWYKKIQSIELKSEKNQQDRLYDWFLQHQNSLQTTDDISVAIKQYITHRFDPVSEKVQAWLNSFLILMENQ